jgi:hypothetical protein
MVTMRIPRTTGSVDKVDQQAGQDLVGRSSTAPGARIGSR